MMPSGHTSRQVTRSLVCQNPDCSQTFVATQPSTCQPYRYCGPSCRRHTQRAKARQTYHARNPPVQAKCKACDATFLRDGTARLYCSKPCQRTIAGQRDKIAKRKYPTKMVSGVCRYQLCMQPFTRRIKGRAPAYCSHHCQREQLNVRRLMNLYQLSEDFVLKSLQQAFCDLCGGVFTSAKDRHFDHDHATGQFRGVLHRACNMAIGNLEDDPGRALQAAHYLQGGRSWFAGHVNSDGSVPKSSWYRDKATE